MIHLQHLDQRATAVRGIQTSLFTGNTRGIPFRDSEGDIDMDQTIFLDTYHPPKVTSTGLVLDAFYDVTTDNLVRPTGQKASTGCLVLVQGVLRYEITGAHKMIRHTQRYNDDAQMITDIFFWAIIGAKIAVRYPGMSETTSLILRE